MRRVAAVAGAAAATTLLAPAAFAHMAVVPAAVEEDTTVLVNVVTPSERVGSETVSVSVRVPGELEIASATAPDGWRVETSARSATWTGGAIRERRTIEFPMLVHGVGPAGDVVLAASQTDGSGEVDRWSPTVTVLPATGAVAPRSHLGRALVAGLVGVTAIAGSLVLLHRLRRPRGA